MRPLRHFRIISLTKDTTEIFCQHICYYNLLLEQAGVKRVGVVVLASPSSLQLGSMWWWQRPAGAKLEQPPPLVRASNENGLRGLQGCFLRCMAMYRPYNPIQSSYLQRPLAMKEDSRRSGASRVYRPRLALRPTPA